MTDVSCLVGDTLKLRLQVYTSAERGVIKDITSLGLVFYGADRAVSPTVVINKSVGSGIEVVEPLSGSAEITLSASDTSLFGDAGGLLTYYIRLIDGIEVYTLKVGRISIKKLPV